MKTPPTLPPSTATLKPPEPGAALAIEFAGPTKDKQIINTVVGLDLCEVDRSVDEKTGEPKREIVLTCLQEGPGNRVDKRYYSRAAVEGLERKVLERKKIFVDHLIDEASQKRGDSLKDWAATVKSTWIETREDGRIARKVRMIVHEQWLWQRCLDAPGEIALSIEGRGAGRKGTVHGEEWMIIEEIYFLNAFKFVPYPGNADMGADLVEGQAANNEEEQTMDLSKLTLEALRAGRPDLVEAMTKETEKAIAAQIETKIAEAKKAHEQALAEKDAAAAEAAKQAKVAEEKAKLAEQAKAGDLKALTEQFRQEMKDGFAEQAKVIQNLREENSDLKRRLDEKEVREKIAAKSQLIDRLLAEANLPEEAKSAFFREDLMRLTERKDGDKIVTVEAQARERIEDRKKLCRGGEAVVTEAGGGAPAASAADAQTDEEKEVVFAEAFNRKYSREWGMKLTPETVLVEYRKRKADKAAEDAAKKGKEGAAA